MPTNLGLDRKRRETNECEMRTPLELRMNLGGRTKKRPGFWMRQIVPKEDIL